MQTVKEDKELIEDYIELKSKLLKEYKGYTKELEYADNNFDEGYFTEKKEKLAIQIKSLGEKIRQFEV